MKNLTLFLALIFITSIAVAQEDSLKSDNEFRTLFKGNGNKTKVSGFGSINLDFGSIENSFGLMMGGEGAVIFNRKFYFGIYGRGLTTLPNYNYDNSTSGKVHIERRGMFGHGGLLVGYIFSPTNPIHFGVSTRIGGGALGLIYFYEGYDKYSDVYYPEDGHEPVFVFTPEANVEMNLTNWFKFRVSIGYQYVSDASVDAAVVEDGNLVFENGTIVKEEVMNSSNFNTPIVSLGFIFGWFK